MGNLFRVSATLLALVCWAPELLAQERGLDPSWTDAPESDADQTPSPAPPEAALPPPPAPPPGAAPPLPWPPPGGWIDPYGRVRVFLHGDDPRMRFEVFSRAKGADQKVPLFVCGNPCPAMLPRGEYRVRVSGVPKRVSGDSNIDVTADASYAYSLPEQSARSGGLALAITGTALVPAGLLLLVIAGSGDCGHGCADGDTGERETAAWVGLGMLVTGAVLTPVGWVQFARNRKPQLEERPFGAPRREARAPRIGVGAAPIPGGAAAGVWGSF